MFNAANIAHPKFYITLSYMQIPCHKMKNCQNGGKTIIDLKDGPDSDPYRCQCVQGYSGDLCEIGRYNKLLLVLREKKSLTRT